MEHKLTSVLPPSVHNVKLSAARTVEHASVTWKMIAADVTVRCGWMVRKKGCTPTHKVPHNGLKGAKRRITNKKWTKVKRY